MFVKTLSVSLVLFGTVMLAVSLFYTRSIDRESGPTGLGWRILFYLIVFFLVGYATVCYLFWRAPPAVGNLVMASILFGGGVFVVLVVRMSLVSIGSVRRIAALERHRAQHDELTDLPNRALLRERMVQALATAKRNPGKVAILLMDLDRFKEINDTLGHHCGDHLLQQVAPRLRRQVRESDTVARLGGDEFAIILPGADSIAASGVARKIIDSFREPFIVEGHSLGVGISIGISEYPRDGGSADMLLRQADVAMYIAKRGEAGFSIYSPTEDQYSLNRLTMINELRAAIQAGCMELHYQPKVRLKDLSVQGVETLVRWRHSELGLIMPDEFVELAEQAGLIRELSAAVLESALRQYASWRQRGIRLPISVNVSIKDVQDIDFPSRVEELLWKAEVPASDVTLELTESSMMAEPERVHQNILRLHELGLSLAIDDFGTGYSSLAYLKQLPASEIKIDKSFVMDMMEDENDAVIVRSTIDLAHNMGRQVVAEGVEHQDILDLLDILGCDTAQGYHICQPLPADELLLWLDQRNQYPFLNHASSS